MKLHGGGKRLYSQHSKLDKEHSEAQGHPELPAQLWKPLEEVINPKLVTSWMKVCVSSHPASPLLQLSLCQLRTPWRATSLRALASIIQNLSHQLSIYPIQKHEIMQFPIDIVCYFNFPENTVFWWIDIIIIMIPRTVLTCNVLHRHFCGELSMCIPS